MLDKPSQHNAHTTAGQVQQERPALRPPTYATAAAQSGRASPQQNVPRRKVMPLRRRESVSRVDRTQRLQRHRTPAT